VVAVGAALFPHFGPCFQEALDEFQEDGVCGVEVPLREANREKEGDV
jgi:hypothetical protein